MNDKSFLVVGASSGIGQAIAEDLVSDGARVISWSRHAPSAPALSSIEHATVDVTHDLGDQDLLVPETLDGVVYAPGSINLGAFRQLKPQTYQDDFNLNVVGAVRVLKAVHEPLTAAPGASVVFFSTVAVQTGMQFHASVAAAKGALHGLARSLAAEYAPKNVRFNVVAPSLTDTPMAERLLSNEKKRDAAAARHPLGRVGAPGDIARTARFFLDPENSWVTGQIIGVDGGLSAVSGL